MHEQPKVSIVIAVYNAGDNLRATLESVANQTYQNIEVIIVDDGSTDESLRICREYAKYDDRVSIIEQPNSGAAKARNVAIRRATGEFIAIIDSDDYVDKKYIRFLVENAIAYDADISTCGFYFQYLNGRTQEYANYDKDGRLLTGREAVSSHFLENTSLYNVFWNKLYRRRLFIDNDIYMPEGEIYEDTRTLYRLYFYAERIIYRTMPLYYYLQRSDSVMNVVSKKNLYTLEKIGTEAEEWIHSRTEGMYRHELRAFKLSCALNTANYMVDNNQFDKKIWRRIRLSTTHDFYYLLSSGVVSKKHKLAACGIISGWKIYKIMRLFQNWARGWSSWMLARKSPEILGSSKLSRKKE
jgi:glycosyltransferase involved in cell wall biosynthesis